MSENLIEDIVIIMLLFTFFAFVINVINEIKKLKKQLLLENAKGQKLTDNLDFILFSLRNKYESTLVLLSISPIDSDVLKEAEQFGINYYNLLYLKITGQVANSTYINAIEEVVKKDIKNFSTRKSKVMIGIEDIISKVIEG